jgi:hypothetical protein
MGTDFKDMELYSMIMEIDMKEILKMDYIMVMALIKI